MDLIELFRQICSDVAGHGHLGDLSSAVRLQEY